MVVAEPEGKITFDDSRAPVYWMRYVGIVDEERWGEHIDQMSTWARDGRQYAVVIDARELAWIPPTYRAAIRDWINRDRPYLTKNCRGGALIFSNAIQRGLWTAILWMTPIPVPVKVFTNVRDGEKWLRSMVQGATQPQI